MVDLFIKQILNSRRSTTRNILYIDIIQYKLMAFKCRMYVCVCGGGGGVVFFDFNDYLNVTLVWVCVGVYGYVSVCAL